MEECSPAKQARRLGLYMSVSLVLRLFRRSVRGDAMPLAARMDALLLLLLLLLLTWLLVLRSC